ncbi:MAG TPA: HD domain-containing protein [Gemmataceae bacterium]|nr:HD domain-containing protein [Gemmataceae bacterium]
MSTSESVPSDNGALREFRFAIGPDGKLRADRNRFDGVVLELPDDWRDAEIFDAAGKRIGDGDGRLFRIPIRPLTPSEEDDELRFAGTCKSDTGPRTFTIVVRRTQCRIWTALLGRGAAAPLHRQTEAALFWYGWRRYRELCGLKRFTGGLSGADVLVLRPMLSKSTADASAGKSSDPVWGSCLLVKSGEATSLQREMRRFETELADRLHPFMAKTEEMLDVCPAEPEPQGIHASRPQDDDDDRDSAKAAADSDHPSAARCTLIGSFLGGDLFEVESFGALMRGTADAARCASVVDRLTSILAVWHAGGSQRTLAEWADKFGTAGPAASSSGNGRKKLLLFDRFDFDDPADCKKYAGGVGWDVPFHKREHLSQHLLGKSGRKDGLMFRLMEMPVRFSLIHGDLHPNNLLVGGGDVWLLDFGATGVNPTLYDFAKLEVYLRLWCLDLHPPQANSDDAAHRFEELLLDHMTGSTGGFEAVCEMARDLGTQPPALHRLAAVIVRIRKQAIPYGTGYPDRRDYLAILYLTVLETIQYAAKEPARVDSYRLLLTLSWLLEDTLSRLFGLEPFPRTQIRFDHRALLTPTWIAAPGAPARVRYLLQREDGQLALAPVAATRGVLQSVAHHLDVFDHTLLVLGYLEAMIHDGNPVDDLFDPARLDRKVEQTLREEGVRLAPMHGPALPPSGLAPEGACWDDARARIAQHLDAETLLVLKWGALFHDVGKPATRQLNKDRDRPAHVAFVGHELYGRRLATGNLESLFPQLDRSGSEPFVRQRIAYLIRYHHKHHQWVGRYRREVPAIFESLNRAERLSDWPQSEVDYFAEIWEPDANRCAGDFLTLLLHGFADALSCRGPERPVPIEEVAAIDRMVLRLFVAYMQSREKLASRFDGFVARFRESLPAGSEMGSCLRSWFLRESDRRDVTFEMFRKKAKEATVHRSRSGTPRIQP